MGQKQSQPPCRPPASHLLPLGDPPFISECEVYHEDEGGPDSKLLFAQCQKYPGHSNFIPVRDLKREHLPPQYQTDEIMARIRNHCDRTVRVSVKYTSPKRPETYPYSTSPYHFSQFRGSNRKRRWGTGTIDQVFPLWYDDDEVCPCHLCKESGDTKIGFQSFSVITAAHVVYDHDEAEQTVFELFYDSEDRSNVKLLYGVRLLAYIRGNDDLLHTCSMDRVRIFCVTHDKDLYKLFEDKLLFNDTTLDRSIGYIISHPHGCCKHVSVGKILRYNNSFSSLKNPKDGSIFKKISLKTVRTHENTTGTYILKVRKNIKCKVAENTGSHLDESFLAIFRSSLSLKCVVEYGLKKGSVLSLPPDSTFLCRKDSLSGTWVEFPTGTKVSTTNGEEWTVLPAMKFKIGSHCFRNFYITYDIPTCPGSSGAMIRTVLDRIDAGYPKTHSGCLVKDGTNRSALLEPGFTQI